MIRLYETEPGAWALIRGGDASQRNGSRIAWRRTGWPVQPRRAERPSKRRWTVPWTISD